MPIVLEILNWTGPNGLTCSSGDGDSKLCLAGADVTCARSALIQLGIPVLVVSKSQTNMFAVSPSTLLDRRAAVKTAGSSS